MPAGTPARRPISTSRTGRAATTAGPARPGPRTGPGSGPACRRDRRGKPRPEIAELGLGELRALGLEHRPGAQAPAVPAPGRDEVFHRGRVLDRGLAGAQQLAADEHRATVIAAERHAPGAHALVLDRQHQDRPGPAGKPAPQARPGGRRAVHLDPFRVDRLVAERCRDLRRHIRRQQALDGCGHPQVHAANLKQPPAAEQPDLRGPS